MEYIRDITVDFSGERLFDYITAIQGDTNSRAIKITILENSKPYTIPTGTKAVLRCKKPDGKRVFNDATINDDGTVTAKLSGQMLTAPGNCRCEIALYGSDGSCLTSTPFTVKVIEASITEDITSSDEFTALALALAKVDNAQSVADTALATATEAANKISEVEENIASHIAAVETATSAANEAAKTAQATASSMQSELDGKANVSHTHTVAGLVETDVDLTTCTVTDGNGSVTSKQLSGSADTFTITLEKGTEYKFKGKLECAGLSITVNGEILATTGDDVSSTSTFEYSGTVDSMTVYIPGGYCTFDNFIAVKRVNGFMTSADKAKLDGLPDDAYSKSETDSKIDLLSLKAEKSGETVRISDACEPEQTADVSIASKNLIPYPYASTTKTVNGLTFTDNGDGSVTVSGTPTGNADFTFATVSVKPGQTFTLCKNQTGADNITFVINERFNQTHQKELKSDSSQNTFTFTTSENTNILHVAIRRTAVDTACTGTFKPQLELGTQATAYTPHVSDISSVSVKKYGKNLIPYLYVSSTKTVNGLTFTDNGNGSITVNGTPTGFADFTLAFVPVKPGQTYTLFKNQTGANNISFVITEYFNQSTQKAHTSDSSENTLTFTTLENTNKLSVAIKRTKDDTACTGTFKPQLELGNAVTDYELYKAPVTYTADSDGKVSGVTLGSDTATLTTDTDGVIINAKYKKDITKAFEELETKLTNAILSNGGNV